MNIVDLNKLYHGDKRTIARTISIVENEEKEAKEICKKIFSHTGNAYRIGITGPPGAGKSTLTLRLTQEFLKAGLKIGILAVDPTSPFTGGALLGDRVRMQEVAMEPNVFVRSMATRGSLGGLSRKTREAADILDASGKDIIIMETVGVGQSELDVAKAADTTLVVIVPESGDTIQAMKAGLMEIADVFCVNKSDREGADDAVLAIQNMLELRGNKSEWNIPIHKVIAKFNEGILDLITSINRHKDHLVKSELLKQKRMENLTMMVREMISDELRVHFWSKEKEHLLQENIEKIYSRELCIYDFAKNLMKRA
jgi:LAO/AO transport system kinase